MSTSTKVEQLTLIEGVFTENEACDVLMNVFTAKLRFNEQKNFSSQERLGREDETAKKRIMELKQSMESMKSLLAQAKANNRNLIISSDITIRLI